MEDESTILKGLYKKKMCPPGQTHHSSINKTLNQIICTNSHQPKKNYWYCICTFAIFQFSKDSLEMSVILLMNINLR